MTPLTAPAGKWSQAVELYTRAQPELPRPTLEVKRLHAKGFTPIQIARTTGHCLSRIEAAVTHLDPAPKRSEFSAHRLGRRG